MSADQYGEHLVFVSHSSLAVGVERSMTALVRAAVARGSRVTVVIPGPGPIEELLAPVAASITIVHRTPQWWMGSDHHGPAATLKLVQALAQSVSWARFLRGLRPTMLLVMSSVCPAPLAGGWLAGLPTVAFLSESVRSNPTLRSVIPKNWIVALVHRWARLTVAVSGYAVAQWGRADLVEFPEVDAPAAGSQVAAEREGGPGLRLVMLGTLSTEKGQADAVQAVAALAARGIPASLDLYGDASSDALAGLVELTERLGVSHRVRHRGRTSDPGGVLAGADLSLICSRNETYGRVTAESILAGTPVVGYDRAGTGEILAGGGGVLVEPTSASLINALATLASDPARIAALRDETRARSRSREGLGNAAHTLSAIESALRGAPVNPATGLLRRTAPKP